MIYYPLSNSIVDDVLLSFIAFINAKTWAYELNSILRTNLNEQYMSLYKFRSEKTGSGSRS